MGEALGEGWQAHHQWPFSSLLQVISDSNSQYSSGLYITG